MQSKSKLSMRILPLSHEIYVAAWHGLHHTSIFSCAFRNYQSHERSILENEKLRTGFSFIALLQPPPIYFFRNLVCRQLIAPPPQTATHFSRSPKLLPSKPLWVFTQLVLHQTINKIFNTFFMEWDCLLHLHNTALYATHKTEQI